MEQPTSFQMTGNEASGTPDKLAETSVQFQPSRSDFSTSHALHQQSSIDSWLAQLVQRDVHVNTSAPVVPRADGTAAYDALGVLQINPSTGLLDLSPVLEVRSRTCTASSNASVPRGRRGVQRGSRPITIVRSRSPCTSDDDAFFSCSSDVAVDSDNGAPKLKEKKLFLRPLRLSTNFDETSARLPHEHCPSVSANSDISGVSKPLTLSSAENTIASTPLYSFRRMYPRKRQSPRWTQPSLPETAHLDVHSSSKTSYPLLKLPEHPPPAIAESSSSPVSIRTPSPQVQPPHKPALFPHSDNRWMSSRSVWNDQLEPAVVQATQKQFKQRQDQNRDDMGYALRMENIDGSIPRFLAGNGDGPQSLRAPLHASASDPSPRRVSPSLPLSPSTSRPPSASLFHPGPTLVSVKNLKARDSSKKQSSGTHARGHSRHSDLETKKSAQGTTAGGN